MWALFIVGLIFLLIFWPIGLIFIILGFIALAMRGSKKEKGIPKAGIEKKCPRCAEIVKAEALICRFCNYEFPKEIELPHRKEQIEEGSLKKGVMVLIVPLFVLCGIVLLVFMIFSFK